MKNQLLLLTTLFCLALNAQVDDEIVSVPNQTEPINFNKETLEETSSNLSGLPKISWINTNTPASWPYVSFSNTDKWPSGAWGRGYLTDYSGFSNDVYADGQYEFYNLNTEGKYKGGRPLIRMCSEFLTGHLHLYLSGYNTGNSLQKVKDGIDYLLAEQISTGENAGAFPLWIWRESQTNINSVNVTGNKADEYSSSYGLQALSAYYLSSINYRRSEVFEAIQNASTYLKNRDWLTVGNSNVSALGLWSLSEAYKVTNDCITYKKIKEIGTRLIGDQEITNGNLRGVWNTGAKDFLSEVGKSVYHDTKIAYHMMVMRGLIEAFNVIPSQDEAFKLSILNTIRKGINHVISYRSKVGSTDLRYAFRYIDGPGIYPYFVHVNDRTYDMQNYFEPIIKLAFYASKSDLFTSNEKTNLLNLSKKLANGFDESNWRHFKSICLYLDYIDAMSNATNIFDWVSSDLNYNSLKISGRVVSGDFDHDGFKDDIAAFYDYGNDKTMINVWKSNGSSFSYLWSWNVEGYNANKVTGKVVSGDFDNDGYHDDIVAFYDYGNGSTKMHQWESNGKTFSYGWKWSVNGYDSNKIRGRVVSGDFDNDGYHDDIAAFYNYGNQNAKLHKWSSNGNSYAYSWGWESTGYDVDKISGRVVSGDFDHDGFKDDIIAFYDYGGKKVKLHKWSSNGNDFLYTWLWEANGYDANKITGRVVSGDFDSNGYMDNIAAFYDYGDYVTKMHRWDIGSSILYSWNWSSSGYGADRITNRVVSGDFGQSCKLSDIGVFYNYGVENTRTHIWLNDSYQGSSSWWLPCSTKPVNRCERSKSYSSFEKSIELFEKDEIVKTKSYRIYPNPTTSLISIDFENGQKNEVVLFNSLGKIVLKTNSKSERIQLDMSLFQNGVYTIVVVDSDGNKSFERVVKQ